MIAKRPVMKADTPALIPASIVSAKAGLATISASMLSPAGIDLYKVFVNIVPMINNIGIATTRPTEHLPNVDFGRSFQDCCDISDASISNYDKNCLSESAGIKMGWIVAIP
jgi:hypothetical protein